MNRIDQIFHDLRQARSKALMPFVTAGDPDLNTTALLLDAMQQAGASVVELGFPFSDPIADGPVIQDSMALALSRGVRPSGILEMVAANRARWKLGLVAMVSYSIVHKWGADRFVAQAAAVGIDGFIFPDLPLEESEPVRRLASQAGLIVSLLIAPHTPIERARQIAQASSGFVYLMARAGVTGERGELPVELADRISALRQVTDLPITVGFGISSPQQVKQVVQLADAAIVGSAIVRRIAQGRSLAANELASQIGGLTAELVQGLSSATGE